MKVSTDQTWGVLIVEQDNKTLTRKFSDHEFWRLMELILNKSQFTRLINNDSTFTLSKKAEKILLDKLNKQL